MSDITAPNEFLTSDINAFAAAYQTAFNSGSVPAVESFFEADGVLVAAPGQPASGEARLGANQYFVGLGLPIQITVKYLYQVGDIALIIQDWAITGTGPDGASVDMSGTTTDVARQGADGNWRYVIDNPFGVV